LTAKTARTSVLFAGSNDGMLHGFKDSRLTVPAADDGKEVFAYVPRAVYPNLYKLTDTSYGASGPLQHQYFVDGPLREADAYVKAPGASTPSWRNYLLGSLGAGGRAVYALDVTDLANLGVNTVRWEISDVNHTDLGYVLSPIKVGVLDNGRWVAIFGNGSSSDTGSATLFVVDIEKAGDNDSSAVQKLSVDTSGGNGLGGVTLIHDADGKITTIYAGDLKGKMWKFAYNASTSSKFEVSGGTALFTATDSSGTVQPITASPVVYNHAQGGKIVIFGTGKLFATADALDTSVQTAYAVWDKPTDTSFARPLLRSNLTGRTLTSFMGTGLAASTRFYAISDLTAIDWNNSRGWRLDLGSVLPAGRVIYPALVVGYDTALISAVAPAQGVLGVCDSLSGNGVNLLLPVQSGLNPTSKTFDTNGDGVASGTTATTGDAYAIGYSTAADGVDVVVRSAGLDGKDGINDAGGGGREGDCTGTSCSAGGECVESPLCGAGTCLSTVQSATAGMTICVPTGAAPTRKMDRMWRRIINPPIH
jgi:type IV pilus assembly protein PilY1